MIKIFAFLLIVSASKIFAQEVTLSNEDYNKSIELYNKGLAFLDEMDSLKQALGLFHRAIQLNPSNADFYYAKAISLSLLESNDSSRMAIEEAISLANCEPDYLLFAANLSFKQSEYNRAIGFYTSALDCNATSNIRIEVWQCHFNRGNAYLKVQEYALAIKDFEKVLEYNSTFSRAYHNRAMAKRRLKDKYSNFEVCQDLKMAIEFGSEISSKYLPIHCK